VPRRVDMAHALVRSYVLLGDMKRTRVDDIFQPEAVVRQRLALR